MWTNYYRLVDRYGPNVARLALLADDVPSWRPQTFRTGGWGCSLRFDFPVAKLLDFRDRQGQLSLSSSPVGLLVLAILKAQELASESNESVLERSRWKLHVLRSLYERGWSRQQVRHLFRFLDWVVRLPEDVDDQVFVELANTEEEKQMSYITSFERYGMRKGMEKGVQEGRLTNAREAVIDALEIRFGDVPDDIRNAVESITDLKACKKLHHDAIRADSIEVFVLDALSGLDPR